MIENKIKPFVLFLLFLVCGGVISIALKFEHMWDFANYHYYNPWAFLNNRVNYDIAVAGINAYYSPFADIPLYYLIEYLHKVYGLAPWVLLCLRYRNCFLQMYGRFSLLCYWD